MDILYWATRWRECRGTKLAEWSGAGPHARVSQSLMQQPCWIYNFSCFCDSKQEGANLIRLGAIWSPYFAPAIDYQSHCGNCMSGSQLIPESVFSPNRFPRNTALPEYHLWTSLKFVSKLIPHFAETWVPNWISSWVVSHGLSDSHFPSHFNGPFGLLMNISENMWIK